MLLLAGPMRTMTRAARFVTPDGTVLDAENVDETASITLPLTGEVTNVTATGFVLDTCPPNADCAPSLHTFDFATEDANRAWFKDLLGTVIAPRRLRALRVVNGADR